jgi:high-affinity iron transporter
MTNFILLIGSALFSRAVGSFQKYEFNHLYVLFTLIVAQELTHHSLGADADSLRGDGPGTFDVRGNIWHLDCCNANNYLDGKGWLLFGALLGWTNSASRKGSFLCSLTSCFYLINLHAVGTVLSYVFYWIAVIVTLVVLKWREGRLSVFGLESTARRERRARQEADTSNIHEKVPPPDGCPDQISELPK